MDRQLARAKGTSNSRTPMEFSREIQRNWRDGEGQEEEGIFGCFGWSLLSFIWSTKIIRKDCSKNSDGFGVASDEVGLPDLEYSPNALDYSPKEFTCKKPGCGELHTDRDLNNWHMETKHPELHGNDFKAVILLKQKCNHSGCSKSFYVPENLQRHLAGHQIVDEIFEPSCSTSTYYWRHWQEAGPTPTLSDATVVPHSSAGWTRRTASHTTSAQTLVQHNLRDEFPQFIVHEDTRELVDADALLPIEVTKVISIEYLHTTIKGVRARTVLVVTDLGTARLLQIVSLEALRERKHIARQVRKILGSHTYEEAKRLQKCGITYPIPFYTGFSLETILSSEADRRLLEAGKDLNNFIHSQTKIRT